MLSEKTSVQLCSFAGSTVLTFFQTTAVKLYQDHLKKHIFEKINEILALWSMVQTYIASKKNETFANDRIA